MTTFEFTLRHLLLEPDDDPEHYLEALYNAGCSDALIGVAKHGVIALSFACSAASFAVAVETDRQNVENTIPDAAFIETVR
ncbi:MAG: hypothetical protein RH946_03730 [Rhodospirillales bacterium]